MEIRTPGRLFAVVVIVALISRALFFDTYFPCGIALMTVFLHRSRLYIYLLPVIIGAIAAFMMNGYLVWGDLSAVLLCALSFSTFGRRKISFEIKALLAGGYTFACNGIYLIALDMLYRFKPEILLFESIAVVVLCFTFNRCCGFLIPKESVRGKGAGSIAAVTATALLPACGLTHTIVAFDFPYAEALPTLAALFFVLLVGNGMGISDGVVSASVCAAMLTLFGSEPPAIAMIMMVGAVAAGAFREELRVLSAICFAAACLGFGLSSEYSQLYLLPECVLIASGAFLLTPDKIIRRLDSLWAEFLWEHSQNEKESKERLKSVLEKYRQCFDEMAKSYGAPGCGGSLTSHQFRGLSQVVSKMQSEICGHKPELLFPKGELKYDVEIGISGYAGAGNLSGDSWQYKELSNGNALIVLSDGMGKGAAAALESSLAASTAAGLIDAGFEVETALRTLNSIFLSRNETEVFATIDICIIDRHTGRTKLYKVGAASTFIKRGEKVEIAKRPSLPIGIVDKLRIDYINFQLRDEDEVIMISDGVTDSDKNDAGHEWLNIAISLIRSKDPQTMCDLIINKAIEKYGIRERDDLTVITARLKRRY